MQFRLRTLLILLAVMPPICAGGYQLWDSVRPKPSPWFIQDGGTYYPPRAVFKLSREAAALKAHKAELEASQP
jgi:hypothetical protein